LLFSAAFIHVENMTVYYPRSKFINHLRFPFNINTSISLFENKTYSATVCCSLYHINISQFLQDTFSNFYHLCIPQFFNIHVSISLKLLENIVVHLWQEIPTVIVQVIIITLQL